MKQKCKQHELKNTNEKCKCERTGGKNVTKKTHNEIDPFVSKPYTFGTYIHNRI